MFDDVKEFIRIYPRPVAFWAMKIVVYGIQKLGTGGRMMRRLSAVSGKL